MERLLHRVAFSSPKVQLAAAETESTIFSKRYRGIAVDQPVFVTSLARAGTTALLEALNSFPGLATQSYSDMPFVLSPLLWAKLTGSFKKKEALRERAHGDGLMINSDSPEAFEEVFWKAFWPEKYGETRISLWHASDRNLEAEAFLRDHMRKVILSRVGDDTPACYLSKNNANIARLGLLRELFPSAIILLVLRDPLVHAQSLLRQHLRFQEVQEADPFAKQYMEDLGHYEFGALHRPFSFPGLEEDLEGRHPGEIDYWLAYWLSAFREVERHKAQLSLLSQEALCEAPHQIIRLVAERVGKASDGAVMRAAGVYSRRSGRGVAEAEDASPKLLSEVSELHRSLLSQCLRP